MGADAELSILYAVLGPDCTTNFDTAGYVVYPLLLLYIFYILAKVCDVHLTQALEFIVEKLKISEDVAGATFLAMGSSAPEIFHAVVATFALVTPTGIANIIGSAIFNLLVIIGITPIFAGKTLTIWWYPTLRDAFFYGVALVEVYLAMADGLVYWYEALVMVISYGLYVLYFVMNQRICEHFGLKPPPGLEQGEGEEKKGAETQLEDSMPNQSPREVCSELEPAPMTPKEERLRRQEETQENLSVLEVLRVEVEETQETQVLEVVRGSTGFALELRTRLEALQTGVGGAPLSARSWVSAPEYPDSPAEAGGPVAAARANEPRPDANALFTVLGRKQQPDIDGMSELSTAAGTVSECGEPRRWAPVTAPAEKWMPSPAAAGPKPVAASNRAASAMLAVIGESGSLSNVLSGGSSRNLKNVLGGGGSSRNLRNVLGKGGVGDLESNLGTEAEEEEKEENSDWCQEPFMFLLGKVMPTRIERVWTLFNACCLVIGIFTYFMADTAERLGCVLGVPQVVMGLVVLAAGTSVPDAIGSIVVAKEGFGDMAVANAVGSNTINIQLGLGLPWLLKTLVYNEPIQVPNESLKESMAILAICLVGYLVMIKCNNWLLTKQLGFALLFFYVASIAWILAPTEVLWS